MEVAHSRALGFAGKEILFRKIEFERYRKPHVVEYPRSAIVLNPQHTRQLRDAQSVRQRDGAHDAGGPAEEAPQGHSDSDGGDEDDDDPRRIDPFTALCSDKQLQSCLQLRWQHVAPVGVGLVNLGNTCFANSVLQALAYTPALAQYFANAFRSADQQLGCPFDFAFALAESFRRMHPHGRGGGGAGAYRPGAIVGNLRLLSKHFSLGRQSDAHEFAVQLLFACQKSLLYRLVGSKKVQPRVAHTTALYRICGGYLLSQVTWSRQDEVQQLLQAGKRQEAVDLTMEAKQASLHKLDSATLCSNTYDPFTVLSVEMAGHSLLHCLDKFCAAEKLDGRCYLTPREVGVRATKQFRIHVPPPVLMIHLKRFGPTGGKISKHIQFPLELDLTPYCTGSSTPTFSRQRNGGCSTAESTAATAAARSAKRMDCRYELNAICVHEGRSIDYGHYYTMAKAANGTWYVFNDSQVHRLSEDELQRAQAYMLFYSRLPSPAASTGRAGDGRRGTTSELGNGMAPSAPPSLTDRHEAVMMTRSTRRDDEVGKELTESEVRAALERRRQLETSITGPLASAEKAKDSGVMATHPAPSSPHKRQREILPTDSDSDDDGGDEDEQRVNRFGAPSSRASVALLQRTESSQKVESASVAERTLDSDTKEVALQRSPKLSRYGGLVKMMRRAPLPVHGEEEAPTGHTNVYRIGRRAVQALHQEKTLSTPETVRRPASAPKFQQRIKDPMWEMEMDRGKVKTVKSKQKTADPFEGTNPFQEVSRGMFDVRGRRRRD